MKIISLIQWAASLGIIGYIGYKIYQAAIKKDVDQERKKKSPDIINISATGKERKGMSDNNDMIEVLFGKPKDKTGGPDIMEVMK